MKDLLSIVSHFQMQGTVREIKPLGSGLINDTYKVTTVEADAPDYVLQRINHAIFQNVEMLQSNISAVTNHIRKKLTEAGESGISVRSWKRKERPMSSVKCFISSPRPKGKPIGMTVRTTGVS